LTSRSTSSSINLLAAINAAAVMEQAGHSSSGSSVAVDKDKWIAYQTERRGLSAELHRQLVDTVGLEQVAARVFCEGDHEGWYKQGLVALRECQEAEEKLLRTAGQVSAGGRDPGLPESAVAVYLYQQQGGVQDGVRYRCWQSVHAGQVGLSAVPEPAQEGGEHVRRCTTCRHTRCLQIFIALSAPRLLPRLLQAPT
jgi:hypothetical protein